MEADGNNARIVYTSLHNWHRRWRYFGILSRLNMLRTDYRQYPTYPHGKIIHVSLGVIAAGLGAVAVPALLEKNYTAVTFLSLAAQQFRDVRTWRDKA